MTKSKKRESKKVRAIEFPRYLMEVCGERRFLTIKTAGVMSDSGYVSVKIVGDVLDADFSVRSITQRERRRISDIADEHSASK